MRVQDVLQNTSRLFLDTAPVIYYIERHPNYFDRVQAIFHQIDAGTIQAVTSTITLSECLVHPIRHAWVALQKDYYDLIVNGTHTFFARQGEAIGVQAAELRARHHLELPDALQIATAMQTNCDAFLTNDSDLKRITELHICVIDELTL